MVHSCRVDAIVLVLLLQKGELPRATTDALGASARAVLGAQADIQLVELDAIDDGVAAAQGTQKHASAVVELRADGNRVHARLLLTSENRWIDRDVGFSDRDKPEERGRTLGFTVASMLPLVPVQPIDQRPPNLPPDDHQVVRPPDVPPSPPLVPRRWIGAIDARGSGAVSVGGAGTSFGATFAVELYPHRNIGVRLFTTPRFGELGAAQATLLTVQAGAGLSLEFGAARPGTFGIGGRVDVFAGFIRVTHFSADDPEPAHLSRWLPGFDAALEGTFRVAPALAVVLGLGIEGFFGSTDVWVQGQPTATLSPFRALADLGIRARF